MSPSPQQTRKTRITLLVEYGKNIGSGEWYRRAKVDDLVSEARRRWPEMTETTLMTYARTAFRILEAKRG